MENPSAELLFFWGGGGGIKNFTPGKYTQNKRKGSAYGAFQVGHGVTSHYSNNDFEVRGAREGE